MVPFDRSFAVELCNYPRCCPDPTPAANLVALPTCEEAEGAAGPLVQVHVVAVDVTDQDAVVVVVQVVPAEHVELPPHGRHDVVHAPLQHGTAGQPLILTESKSEMWTGKRKVERKRRRGRLIFKHIHAWVIDVCSVLDK